MNEQAKPGKIAVAATLTLALAGGAFFDFLVYGVAKIVWAVVYIPLYAVLASIVHTQLSRTRWARLYKTAFFALLAGGMLARFTLVNRHRQATYVMTTGSALPFTLHSADWPRTLVVSSENLAKALAGKPPGVQLPVTVGVVSDYGCISAFEVNSVDGVDVEADPSASWTWRDPATGPSAGPGLEDQELPWCRIHLYRTVSIPSKR